MASAIEQRAPGVVDVERLDHPPVDGGDAAPFGGGRGERIDHSTGLFDLVG